MDAHPPPPEEPVVDSSFFDNDSVQAESSGSSQIQSASRHGTTRILSETPIVSPSEGYSIIPASFDASATAENVPRPFSQFSSGFGGCGFGPPRSTLADPASSQAGSSNNRLPVKSTQNPPVVEESELIRLRVANKKLKNQTVPAFQETMSSLSRQLGDIATKSQEAVEGYRKELEYYSDKIRTMEKDREYLEGFYEARIRETRSLIQGSTLRMSPSELRLIKDIDERVSEVSGSVSKIMELVQQRRKVCEPLHQLPRKPDEESDEEALQISTTYKSPQMPCPHHRRYDHDDSIKDDINMKKEARLWPSKRTKYRAHSIPSGPSRWHLMGAWEREKPAPNANQSYVSDSGGDACPTTNTSSEPLSTGGPAARRSSTITPPIRLSQSPTQSSSPTGSGGSFSGDWGDEVNKAEEERHRKKECQPVTEPAPVTGNERKHRPWLVRESESDDEDDRYYRVLRELNVHGDEP